MKPAFLAALAAFFVLPSHAESPVAPPVLQWFEGLPGKQVRLDWDSTPGVRYRIEKSNDLGTGGVGWSRVAIVEATASTSYWVDPMPRDMRGAFYRILQPQAEVFSIAEPVLHPFGGSLMIHGQCIPDGSYLKLEIEGAAPVSAALVSTGPGQWTATFSGPFAPGANILSAAVTNDAGTVLAPVDVGITITATGFAADAPPNSLPPASPYPMGASKPVPRIGIVVKKNPGHPAARMIGDDCDDAEPDEGPSMFSASARDMKPSDPCRWTDGPCRQARVAQSNPMYQDSGHGGQNPFYGSDRRMFSGRNGMPGEVTLEYDALTLACPAGPPITWTMSYRSVAPVSSGHGTGWDFSYNIFIQASSSTAPAVTIHDGAGRADVFRRAADGTYRADGFSRVGQFIGDVFKLTFANGGTWTFRALGGTVANGRIGTITDPNGNRVSCSYDGAGRLSGVSSAYGQSISIAWTADGISTITDHTNRSVSFAYFGAGDPDGPEGDLKTVSAPTASGQPPVNGVSFTYSTKTGDPRLDHNLLSVTDGGGNLLESFTYANATTVASIDYDTLATHSSHEPGHEFGMTHSLSAGRRVVYENDELGRVTETVFDRLHRPLSFRQYTGFHPSPGAAVSAADFPLSGKVRPGTPGTPGDPDYFETTWTYNTDSNVTKLVRADGSKDLITYGRDLNPACAVFERGNARVQSLVSSFGEMRTITMEYTPNSGTPECDRPGNPISGLCVRGGKGPLPNNASAFPGNPIGGLNIKGGKNPGGAYATRRRVEVLKSNKTGDPNANRGITINTSHIEYETAKRLIWSPRSNVDGPDDDCDSLLVAFLSRKGYDYYQAQSSLRSGHISRKGYDYYQAQSALQSAGAQNNPIFAGGDDDGDMVPTEEEARASSLYGATVQIPVRDCRPEARLTKLTTSHGQVFTWTYDTAGNLTSAISPVPGKGTFYQYDAQGRLTDVTTTNGAAGEFHNTLTYGTDGFLATSTQDSGGRNLATSFEHDALGRVTSIVDPMNAEWTLHWNPRDVCTKTESPPVGGQRIATDFTYDAAGRLVRCDVDHRDAAGNADPNEDYTTFWVYDGRGRLAKVAVEERPTHDAAPDPGVIGNYAVTDYTYDAAGQVARISTPAACRGQSTDAIIDLAYDERGLLHRSIAGGLGNPASVTTEHDYDTLGACVREACVATDGGVTLYTYDGFHRPVSITDAMGNQTVFTYDEAGRVTSSFYGEIEDDLGGGENILLSRVTTHLGNNLNWNFGGGSIAGKSDGRKTVMARDIVIDHLSVRSANRHYAHVDCPSKGSGARACPPDRPVRCGDGTCAAFFAVYREDDVIEVERFSPTESPPFAKETTVIDRSPAGLVMNITRNGDLLDSFTYDSSGALSSMSNAARTIDLDRDGRQDVVLCGKTEHFRVASPPTPKTFTYVISRDSLGRITAVTDGVGNANSIAYDSLGRCTALADPGRPPVIIAYDGGDATGPYSYVGTCDADANGVAEELGRALVRCGVPLQLTDPNGYTETFTYDALGRLARCDLPDGTFETVAYDARGFVISVSHQDGSWTEFTNDPLGQATTTSRKNIQLGALAVEDTISVFDGLGRPVSVTRGTSPTDSSTVEMAWDSVGNPIRETTDGRTVSRAFNHRGRTSVTYPDGTVIDETRNEFGQLTSTGNRLSPHKNVIHFVGMRVYQTEQANGVKTIYSYRGQNDTAPPGDSSYDSCVRVTTTSGTTTLADTLIRHSPDQRVTKATALSNTQLNSLGRSRTYTYDGLGRVTGCLTEKREVPGGPVVTESDVHYTLDAAGRRVSVTGGNHPGAYTQSSTLPPGDRQMGQYTTWPGGSLEWDDRGNLKLFTNGTDVLNIDSDLGGRLTKVHTTNPGMATISYPYDALGRLAGRIVYDNNGTVAESTTFVWDGNRIAQELDDPDGTGTLSAAFTFVSDDSGVKHCISTRNGTLYYPVNTNGYHVTCGQPRTCAVSIALTGGTGSVIERYDCDEAGELQLFEADGTAKTTEIGPVRWMAPESMRDRTTGFIHGHGCVYSPLLGTVTHKEKPKYVEKPLKYKTGHITLIK